MKRQIFLFLSLSLLLFSSMSAQTPTPTIDDKDTLKISTTLIQIDATVTDKKGNVVTDLKPEDFEVYENGKKQDITNFSFIALADPQANQNRPAPVQDKNSVPIPAGNVSDQKVRRTLALVVDDLGLNFGNVFYVKQSLRKFVNEQMQEGDLVAIIRTGAGIGALQSFTSDKRQLLYAIDKIKWNAYGRSGIGTFSPIETTLKEDLAGTKRNDGSVSAPLGDAADKEFVSQLQEFRNDNFAAGTLGALNYIINGMTELPGRKGLILFSEGFSTATGMKPGTSTASSRPNRVLPMMRILADRANRASVVLYTIDPRGLQIPEMANSDDNIRDVMSSLSNSVTMSNDPRELRNREFLDSQGSLIYLAKETGGFAVINQNDIDGGIQRAVTDQGSYYLLGYQPDGDTFDPKQNKFNKLEVKVVRPGLEIRYRSGFFGLSDEKILPAQPKTSGERLVRALTSPFGLKDVNITLYPVFQNDAKTGSMIQALVHIDANDLKFTKTPDGKDKVAVDIVAMTFGENGLQVDEYSKNFTLSVSGTVYQRMLTNGLVFSLPVPVKKAGAYQFRVALRDTASDRIGAASQFIEVPDVKKRVAISSVLLDNFSASEWQKVSSGGSRDESERSLLLDAARRQYKTGTVLSYFYVFYNSSQRGTFDKNIRLIKDGKVIYEEPATEIIAKDQADPMRLLVSGAVSLGKELASGSYLLQVIVTDRAKTKRFVTQHVEFEIVD